MTANAKRGWIGVDVGTRAIKLAQVEQADGRLRLREAVVVPRTTPEPGPSPADLGLAGCRDEVLAALAAGKDFAGRTAACTLSMHWCHTKSVKVTGGDEASQRAAVGAELDGLCGPEQCEFDFWETGAADPPVHEVISVSIPRRGVMDVARGLNGCGLDCRVLDAMPLALARAVQMTCGSGESRPLAVVDWGFGDATFSAISGRTPTFVRRLRGCGFGSVLRQLGNELGLHTDEVEALLACGRAPAPSDPQETAGQLQEAIVELAPQVLRTMAEELQRTLKFLAAQAPKSVPECTWLFGAGAVWTGAADFLAAKTGRPVEVWRFRNAGIHNAVQRPLAEEVLAPAISLSTLAWSNP